MEHLKGNNHLPYILMKEGGHNNNVNTNVNTTSKYSFDTFYFPDSDKWRADFHSLWMIAVYLNLA